MAHDLHIDEQTHDASLMYVGEAPWHGLGTRLGKPATSAEAMKAANLDWRVAKLPLRAIAGDDTVVTIEDRFAIIREDRPGNVFGVVGPAYTPLQNADAFSFFDEIVGSGAAMYHTAGALGKGERVWILARLPGHIRVIGDDITDKYLLLSNSHDGESSVQIKFTPIRVVCCNTLTIALRQGHTLRIPHLTTLKRKLHQAHRMLGLIRQGFEEIEEVFTGMAKVGMDQERLNEYLTLVFPNPSLHRENEKQWLRHLESVRKCRKAARQRFEKGRGTDLKGVKGTLWAAYNGITEMVDHATTGATTNNRLQSIWFGEGYRVKVRAFEKAKQIMNG